jgi:hypothetical protein
VTGADKPVAGQLQENTKPREYNFKPGNEYRFKSGYDPRRNYHGRPKDHDELRELIRDIASEEETSNGEKYNRVYLMIRQMFVSKQSADKVAILEHGWGKVPQPIQIDKMSDDDLRKFIAQQLGESSSGSSGSAPAQPDADAAGADPADNRGDA